MLLSKYYVCTVDTKMALPFLFLVNEAGLARKLVHKLEEWEIKRDHNSNT